MCFEIVLQFSDVYSMDNNTYCKKGKLKAALVATSGLVQDSYESKTFAKVIFMLITPVLMIKKYYFII